MANSSFSKTSISLDSPVFTTKITTPIVYGGSGTTATLTLKGTSNAVVTGSTITLQSTGGYVGIGTTSPQTYLHVSNTSNATPLIYFGNNAGSGGYGHMGWDSGGNTIGWIGTTYSSDSARFDIRMKGTASANAVVSVLGSGNVGIGTITPATTLVVAQPGISYVPTLGTSPTRGFSILGSGGLYGLYEGLTNTGDAWMQVMRNDSAVAYSLLLNPVGGNVGIGIGTTPSTLLHLKAGAPTLTLQSTGAGSVATPVHRKYMFTDYNNAESGSIDMLDQGADTWRADMVFKTRHTDSVVYEDMRLKDGTMTIRLLATGSLTSASGVITSSSDQTLKTSDGFIDNAICKVMNLTPRYFYWNEKSGLDKCTQSIRQLGFYAQEINKILGEEVANTPEEGKDWGFYDRGVIAMLTKAMQEQQVLIEENKKQIHALCLELNYMRNYNNE